MKRKHALITASAAVLGVCGIMVAALQPRSPAMRERESASPSDEHPPHATRSSGRSLSGAKVLDPLDSLKGASDEEFSESLAQVVAAWDDDQLASNVADFFKKSSTGNPADELRLALLRRWASKDPEAAARWAASLTHEPDRASAFDQIVLAWSAKDADAAFEWLKSLREDPARNQAWSSLSYEVSRDDAPKAFEMALPLIHTPEGLRCLEHAVANWALIDQAAALARVQDLSDSSVRNSALAALATSWAETDPRSAATLVAESMEPGPVQDRSVAAIVQRWAQKDPSAAETWIDAFPESVMKQQVRALIAEQATAAGLTPLD